MDESKLKTNSSFASATTVQNSYPVSDSQRKHLSLSPSVYTDKSSTPSPTHTTAAANQFKKPFLTSFKKTVGSLFAKYWFLLGLFIAIILAIFFPNVARKGGYLRAEWTIKWGAVIVIFLISGLSLRTKILAETILRLRLHFLIQTINLIIIPFTVFGLVLLFFKCHMNINSLLLVGVVIAASTPTTVSSNVVMTKNADGNEASALMNAALGNVLGIFVSPALVSAFQGPLLAATPEDESAAQAGGQVDFVQVLKQLGLTVLVPLIVGQIFQWFFTDLAAKIKVKCRLSDVSSFMLLTMVWSVFSDAVYSGSFAAVKPKDVVAVAIMNAGFYILFSLLCLVLARLPLPRFIETPAIVKRLRYSREDTVAVMFCGATKTVAMGVPLINVLYQNGDPGTVGVLSTPLLLYHVEQLIFGNIEVEILKKWVKRGKARELQKQQQQSSEETDEAIAPFPSARDEEESVVYRDSEVTHVASQIGPHNGKHSPSPLSQLHYAENEHHT
ncbi:SBF-like CPA transporter family-domain-containing protein [Mycotypha africana]|uniref:SBF-like CPA transporter family-domain-containing protein n=1 Tax=Mycotypha africana TaxID=64632 RepID=UPI0023005915|nr:SBF-like CPA transporter family-domain-containing protein [Mycotypha africana]KAI8971857.1 SBF-like CPA transporter family-domain-containing protein [Mycotypha africana]